MEFINLTPFGAMAYRGVDVHGREYDIFAMRTLYRLERIPTRPGWPQDWFEAVLVDDEDAPPLTTEDRFLREPGTSSTLAESDLAPFKPRCDVWVTGHAHAPAGQAARQWTSRLRVNQPLLTEPAASTSNPPPPWPAEHEPGLLERVAWQQHLERCRQPRPMAPGPNGESSWQVLIDKALLVHGPRQFVRGRLGGWTLHSEEARSVPLNYELAFGGACVVANPLYTTGAPDEPEFLINEVCFTNPLGCGWLHRDYADALRQLRQSVARRLKAPQFEYPDEPITALDFTAQQPGLDVRQMQEAASAYAHRPAGFGPIGRPWTPRIQHAGTYDQAWLQSRWPGLPQDFDMAYWNCAPADQQIPHPRADLLVELIHLVNPALAPTGHAVFDLPGHRAGLLLQLKGGLLMQAQSVIDTIHVDTDNMTVALVWRAAVAHDLAVERAEARFERDPTQPLIRFEAADDPYRLAATYSHG